jgi:hypothetical protein
MKKEMATPFSVSLVRRYSPSRFVNPDFTLTSGAEGNEEAFAELLKCNHFPHLKICDGNADIASFGWLWPMIRDKGFASLTFESDSLDAEMVRCIVAALSTRTNELRLIFSDYVYELPVLGSLLTTRSLRSVALHSSPFKLSDDAFSFLRDRDSQIEELDLSGSRVDIVGLKLAIGARSMNHLKTLSLRKCKLGDDDRQHVVDLVWHSDITSLDLTHNKFTPGWDLGYAFKLIISIARLEHFAFDSSGRTANGNSLDREKLRRGFNKVVGEALRANTTLTSLKVAAGDDYSALVPLIDNLSRYSAVKTLDVGRIPLCETVFENSILRAILNGAPLSCIKTPHPELQVAIEREREFLQLRRERAALAFCWKHCEWGTGSALTIANLPHELLSVVLPRLQPTADCEEEEEPPLKRRRVEEQEE